MRKDSREKFVSFVESETKESFEKLKSGKFEEKELHKFIDRALDDLKKNPFTGIKIPKKLWPKEYAKKYKIANLWKYDLPNAWRLVYTVKGSNIKIVAIILEWFDHKKYERKFKY